MENFKFNIALSDRGYATKEEGKAYANRLGLKIYSVSFDEFIEYIKHGYAYSYCFKSGYTETEKPKFENVKRSDNPEYFISTQIISFDLDYMPVDFDSFISSIELKPSYAYTSYSYNEENKIYKYRLIYLLNEPVYTHDDFYSIYNNIANQLNLYSFEYIDKKDGKTKSSFDVRKINQFYFGTNSSTGNFKEYISYNVYNINNFLRDIFNKVIPFNNNLYRFQKSNNVPLNINCTLDNINCTVIDNDVTNNKFDITEYKFSSDLIVTDSKFYFDIPDEYYEIYTTFNGYKKEKVKITNGSRTKTLYAVGQKFKHLNPDITKEELTSFLNYWLKANCENETDIITFKDLTNIANSIFKTEFNAKPSKHGKFKVNMKECGEALHNEGNYSYTPLDCVHFALKEKTNDKILSNYDFSTSVSENLKNLKTLGINTTYTTINNVMQRTGLDKYSEKFNLKEYILEQIENNPNIKQKDIIDILQDKVSDKTVKRMFKKLQEENIIINKGTKKEPLWKKC